MNERYRWSADVESAEMDGAWIIMNAKHFTMTKLEDVGGFLWENMRLPRSTIQLVDTVVAQYDVEEETARNDVSCFLEKLLQLQLIEEVS